MKFIDYRLKDGEGVTVSEKYIKWSINIDLQKMFFRYKTLLGYKTASELFAL